jgi:hypothetical protein
VPNKIEIVIIFLAIVFADRLQSATKHYQGVVFVLVVIFGIVCAVVFMWGIGYGCKQLIQRWKDRHQK